MNLNYGGFEFSAHGFKTNRHNMYLDFFSLESCFRNIYALERACDAALPDWLLLPTCCVLAWELYRRAQDSQFCSTHDDPDGLEHSHDEPFHGDSSYPARKKQFQPILKLFLKSLNFIRLIPIITINKTPSAALRAHVLPKYA